MEATPLYGMEPPSFSHQSTPNQEAGAPFPFKLHADLSPLDREALITPLLGRSGSLTRVAVSCLRREGDISIDFGELEAKLVQNLIAIYGTDTIEKSEEAVRKLIQNKILFVDEVSNHIRQDIDYLSEKFAFNKQDIDSIQLLFPAADTHNNGKSPVIITFILKTRQEIKIVYKPRDMTLERLVCDSEKGLFNSINKDARITAPFLPTYGVLAIENHGYAEFIEGKVLYNEEVTSQVKYGDTNGCFMKINKTIIDPTEYLVLLNLRNQLKGSKKGSRLLKNPQLVNDTYFCESQEISEVLSKIKSLSPPLNDLKKTIKLLKSPEKLAEFSFFVDRDMRQLLKDYMLFKCLKQINVVDLHAANFIAKTDQSLVPIDLECFDHEATYGADEILPLIEIILGEREMEAFENAAKHLETILKDYLPEFERIKRETPVRFLPISTSIFMEIQGIWLRNETESFRESCQMIMDALKSNNFEPDSRVLEQELIRCFDQFEIPYFLLFHSQLTLNGQLLGERKEGAEK